MNYSNDKQLNNLFYYFNAKCKKYNETSKKKYN